MAVSDEDVDEQVAALRERFATLVDVERAAADGDFVVIDLVAQQDGETVEGAELTGMSYKVGRGGMLDGLDEALDGMAAGATKALTSQLVGGDLVGQDVEVTVQVAKVQEQQLPDYDDEFAQLGGEGLLVAGCHAVQRLVEAVEHAAAADLVGHAGELGGLGRSRRPARRATRSMTTKSPSAAARSTSTRVAKRSRSAATCSSTSSSVTATSSTCAVKVVVRRQVDGPA